MYPNHMTKIYKVKDHTQLIIKIDNIKFLKKFKNIQNLLNNLLLFEQ